MSLIEQNCITNLLKDNDFLRFMMAFDPEFVQDLSSIDDTAREAASFAIAIAEETAVVQRINSN